MRVLLFLSFLLLISAEASVSQGKKVFSQRCAPCHIEGKYFASKKKAKQWKILLKFQDKTNPLADFHLDSPEANASSSYFLSQEYKQNSKHLKDLLQKYSKDRGSHNSCY